jgi:hypothetical protein
MKSEQNKRKEKKRKKGVLDRSSPVRPSDTTQLVKPNGYPLLFFYFCFSSTDRRDPYVRVFPNLQFPRERSCPRSPPLPPQPATPSHSLTSPTPPLPLPDLLDSEMLPGSVNYSPKAVDSDGVHRRF